MILRSAAGGQLVKVSTQTAQTPKIVYLRRVKGIQPKMPGPLAVIAAAGIMFTFIWAVCKVFKLDPTRTAIQDEDGFVSGFILGQIVRDNDNW
jgi:hypothetical protein